jgi:hypothetical protein
MTDERRERWRDRGDGILEARNEKGQVVAVQAPKGHDEDGRPVYSSNRRYPWSQIQADKVLTLVTQGKTLKQISKMPGMPCRDTLGKWKRDVVGFKEQWEIAEKLQAEYHRDEALEIARNSKESRVQSDRLKVDTLKWAAEMGDRSKYGKQTKLVGDADHPIAFLIATGVPEPEKPPEIDVTKTKDESHEIVSVDPAVSPKPDSTGN